MTTKEEENFRMDVESILFGGPMSKDLGTRVEWLQSIHRRVKDGLVARANDAEKARDAAQALADEITGLKVELAAMMKERDKERAHANEWLVQKHDAEKARDAALADLSQARAELHAIAETCSERGIPTAHEKGPYPAGRSFLSRWTAAVARAEAAEASAAAMREALKGAKQWMFTCCDPDSENGKAYRRDKQEVMDVLSGDAGRALLDRHAAELAQMREENARLRTEHPDAPTCIVCGCETVNYIYDYNDTGVMRPTCRDCVQALFGRAVAALQAASPYIRGAGCYFGNAGERDLCIGKGSNRSKRCGACQALFDVYAILSDPTATAAADAYRAQQEERADLEAVYEAAKYLLAPDADPNDFGLLGTAVAKVDARRGRGGR